MPELESAAGTLLDDLKHLVYGLLSRFQLQPQAGGPERFELPGEFCQIDRIFFSRDETMGTGLVLEVQQAINVRLAVAVVVAERHGLGDLLAESLQRVKELPRPCNSAKRYEPATGRSKLKPP